MSSDYNFKENFARKINDYKKVKSEEFDVEEKFILDAICDQELILKELKFKLDLIRVRRVIARGEQNDTLN